MNGKSNATCIRTIEDSDKSAKLKASTSGKYRKCSDRTYSVRTILQRLRCLYLKRYSYERPLAQSQNSWRTEWSSNLQYHMSLNIIIDISTYPKIGLSLLGTIFKEEEHHASLVHQKLLAQ